MRIHSNIFLLAIAATLVAQPGFAQLRSVLERDDQPVERIAQLDGPHVNSYRFQADRIVANRPSAAPSVLAHSNIRLASELQPEIAINKIQIQVDGPTQITSGMSYSYFATVENPGDIAIEGLQVSLAPNSGLRPAPNSVPALFLARLEPRFKGRFEFKLIADRPGQANLGFAAIGKLAEPANADVNTRPETNHLSGYAVYQVQVVRPQAITQLNGPVMMYIGTDANYAIKVSNLSDKPLPNVAVFMEIPDGLEIVILDRQAKLDAPLGRITWQVPFIQPNQSEIIQFRARAIGGGQQVSRVGVIVGGQSTNVATLSTTVVNQVKARTTSNLNGIYTGR